MPATTKGYDLTVKLPSERVVRIEVKTTDDGQVKPKWLIQRQYREVTDSDLYFVFVAFDGDELRAAYVLPSAVVAKHLDEVNTAYDERNPTAKAARPYKVIAHDSFLPQYNMGWLEPYNDDWDVVFVRLNP